MPEKRVRMCDVVMGINKAFGDVRSRDAAPLKPKNGSR